MLSLQEIEKYYPEKLKKFKRNILREYLQYKILQIIFNSEYANKLSFLGGTALKIIYDNSRFSEDLDFDNCVVNLNTTKNRKPLIIPLSRSIVPILKDYIKILIQVVILY